MSRVALALVCLLSLALPGPAAAAESSTDDTQKAKIFYVQAQRAYNLGHYEEALVSFEKAYSAKPIPGLLYNVAQCHRLLGNLEQARRVYRAFLNQSIDPRQRTTAQENLAEVEQALEAQAKARVSQPTALATMETARPAPAAGPSPLPNPEAKPAATPETKPVAAAETRPAPTTAETKSAPPGESRTDGRSAQPPGTAVATATGTPPTVAGAKKPPAGGVSEPAPHAPSSTAPALLATPSAPSSPATAQAPKGAEPKGPDPANPGGSRVAAAARTEPRAMPADPSPAAATSPGAPQPDKGGSGPAAEAAGSRHIVFWASLGASVAAGATGGFFGMKSKSSQDALAQGPTSRAVADANVSSLQSDAKLGNLLVISAGALLATAAAAWFLGLP